MPEKLELALSLAKTGFHVFPLVPNEKIPATDHGFKDATADIPTVKKWWLAEPLANIGIYPGASNHVVLDIDVKDPRYGDPDDTIRTLEEQLGCELGGTYTVRTPSGGLHLYYRAGDDECPISSSVKRLHPAVDVRASGGYVVAGGSRTDAGSYRVECPVDVAVAPEPLVGALVSQQRESIYDRRDGREGDLDLDEPSNVAAATRFLQQTDPAIEGQGGNDHTYKTAALVRDYGISMDLCIDLMDIHWNPRCDPEWDVEDLTGVVENVYKYANREKGARAIDTEALAGALQQLPPQRLERLRVLSRSQLSSLPDPLWIVQNALERSSLSLLVGRYGSYKSFCALDIALSIATGESWAGLGSRQAPVLYLAGEGAAGLKSRIDAWEAMRQVQVDDAYFSLVPEMPLFDSPEDFHWLNDQIAGIKPGLVIVDTVARASVGLDENSTRDMGIFIKYCDTLVQQHQTHVLLVHHTGKEDGKGSRGSIVLPSSVHTELHIEANAPDQSFKLSMYKQKNAMAWDKALGFKGRQIAGSLAFERDDASAITQKDMVGLNREIALDKALEGVDIPLTTSALIDAMAEISEVGGRERLRSWLKSKAQRGDDRAYLDGNTWMWQAVKSISGDETDNDSESGDDIEW